MSKNPIVEYRVYLFVAFIDFPFVWKHENSFFNFSNQEVIIYLTNRAGAFVVAAKIDIALLASQKFMIKL